MDDKKALVDRAIDMVREANESEAQDFRLIDIKQGFLGGALFTISFKSKLQQESSYTNRVYFNGKELRLFRNDELLLSILGATFAPQRSFIDIMFDRLEKIEAVSGIIALAIAGTIIYMTIFSPGSALPDILSTALTTILGFYFGRATAK